jgi:hypothetical protein
MLLLSTDYPFLGVLWSMLVFFLWIAWFVMLFQVIADIFRRRDASGWNKTAWLIFVIIVPFIGVFAYLIANSDDMAARNNERLAGSQQYARSADTGSGAAGEIERAKSLLDSGAVTQAEFDAMKAKALA